jgi:hypothetical protein
MSPLTKMLIVLQLVFSLVTSVVLTLYVSKQQNYKETVVNEVSARIAAQAMATAAQAKVATLEQQLSGMQSTLNQVQSGRATEQQAAAAAAAKADADLLAARSQISQLSNQNTSLTAANAAAAASVAVKDTELGVLRPQVADYMAKNADLYRAKNEADNQLRAAEMAIKKLQEQLVQGTTGGGATAAEGSTGAQVTSLSNAASNARVNAKISRIANGAGGTLVQMPLGTRDGVQVNTRVFIYRGATYIADAVVQRVTPDESVAQILNPRPGVNVQEGDMVSTIGR